MPADKPPDQRPRCKAKSKQTGEQCKRRPHPGADVCIIHGAGAPHVKKNARERLLEAASPAAQKLIDVMNQSFDEKTQLIAARYILDRAGFAPKSSVELSGPGGGPIQHEDRSGSWFEYCTLEEKRIVKSIAEKAEARRREEVGEMSAENEED